MLQHFAIDALAPRPWKNGGGSTREIACWPPGAGLDDFDWRVSIASVAASGPFSRFAGVDRTIMLLKGDGLRLQAPGLDHLLDTLHAPFAFSGDVALNCTLLGGESIDLNAMSRRTRGRAGLRIVSQAMLLAHSVHGVLMSVNGQWRVGGATLAEGQGVWWAGQSEAWSVAPASPGAKLVVMRWEALGTSDQIGPERPPGEPERPRS